MSVNQALVPRPVEFSPGFTNDAPARRDSPRAFRLVGNRAGVAITQLSLLNPALHARSLLMLIDQNDVPIWVFHDERSRAAPLRLGLFLKGIIRVLEYLLNAASVSWIEGN